MSGIPKKDNLEGRVAELERIVRTMGGSPQSGYTSLIDANGVEIAILSETGINVIGNALTVDGSVVRAVSGVSGVATSTDVTLTNSPAVVGSVTMPVPSWVQTAIVLGWVSFQMSNASGSVQNQGFRVQIEGIPSSGYFQNTVPHGSTGNATDHYTRTLVRGSNLGNSILVESVALVVSGPNSTNYIKTTAFALLLG